jgi:PAS domain S-box-containing protein
MVDPVEGVASIDLRQSTIFSRLRGLLEVTRVVRTGDDLPALLAAIAQTVSDSLGYRTVVINLYRREWDDFVVSTVHGSQEARDALLGQVRQISDWLPLLDERFLQRGAYLLPHGEFDWSAHDAWTPDLPVVDDPNAWHPEDALFVPMRTSDGVLLGVLSVDEPISGRRPTGDEIDVLVAVGEHAALAVQSAQEDATAKANSAALERLLEVSTRLNDSGDARELLQHVCSAISEALGFEKVSVQLLDRETSTFASAAQVGFTEEERRCEPLTPDQLDLLLRPEHDVEGCFLIPSETAEALLGGRTGGYRSKLNGRGPHAWRNHWLLVPLHDRRGGRIGYIWADDPVDRLRPEPGRLRILRAFSNQATTALDLSAQLEAIRASSAYHRALIDASPVAVVDFDFEGRVRSWNAAATQIFGWTAEEAIGRFSPIVPDEERELFVDNIARIRRGELIRDLDLVRLRRDGSTVEVRTSAGPVRGADGEVSGVVSMMVDVSERKRSEQALAASEARKDAILRAAPEPVVIVDGEGLVVEANPAAEETFGWTQAELVGRPFPELFLAAESRDEIAQALKAGSGHLLGARLEVTALRSDQRPVAAEVRITRIELDGPPLYAVSLDDVTKRREREHRLRDAEATYRTLVEQLPLATYINEIGLPVKTRYISPQIEQMLGYAVSQWLEPDFFWELVHPDDVDGVKAALERTHVKGEPFRMEYRVRAADGRWLWVLDETTAVRDAEYRPLFLQGFMMDVTERHDHEVALRRSEQLYRHVVENSHDLIFVVDLAGGGTRYVSPAVTAVLGWTADEFLSLRFEELIEPSDLTEVREYFDARLAGGDPEPPVTRVRRKDGSWATLQSVISILRDEQGDLTGYVSVARPMHRVALRPAAS